MHMAANLRTRRGRAGTRANTEEGFDCSCSRERGEASGNWVWIFPEEAVGEVPRRTELKEKSVRRADDFCRGTKRASLSPLPAKTASGGVLLEAINRGVNLRLLLFFNYGERLIHWLGKLF